MKLISKLLVMLALTFVWAGAIGVNPIDAMVGASVLTVGVAFMGGTGVTGAAFGDTIAIGPIADELKKYIKVADGLPAKWFYHPDVTLRKYAKKITKVMGVYQVPMSVMSAVVQGFKAEWTPLGKTTFLGKEINNFHLKVNLPINVTEILSFYKADMMYEENLKLQDRTISKYIINNLGERVVHDMELLSIDGEYDASLMNTEFGYSMKGLYRVLQEYVTSTIAGTTDHPVFIIPANEELTTADPSAIIDEVDHFERSIPKRFRSRVKEIFIERFYYDEFKAAKRLLHGSETNVTTDEFTTTYGGRKLVPLDSDKMGSMMFATIKDNLLDLVDVNDVPQIHDIQVQDYDIKIFGEGRGGFNVGINQCTFIRSEETSTLGLHNATQNKLFYDLSETSGSGSGS
jgi:hypothetical protein